MPWNETCAMSERRAFMNERLDWGTPVGELCRRYGISRTTGHKWIERFREGGMEALADRSRARWTQAHETPDWIVQLILDMKKDNHSWGPWTIHSALYKLDPQEPWPARSTVGEILRRHNLVKPRKRRNRAPPCTRPLAHATSPNVSWSADFMGQFPMGDGSLCYPLTMTDNHSRMLLCCTGLHHPRTEPAIKIYERVFREHGLPESIRTDNGSPFGSTALGGLTRLSVWLIRLGVYPERIEPGHPEQNGRHERMHRTLRAATARPPRGNMSAQQRAFNSFRQEYNEDRPHQALGLGVCPADIYAPSPRPYPERLPKMVYPDGYLVRSVRHSGQIKLNGELIYIASGLMGECVGLKPVGHDRWQLYFGMAYLGVVDARKNRVIRPVKV